MLTMSQGSSLIQNASCFYSVCEVSMSFHLVFTHKVDFISWVINSNCYPTAKRVIAECFVLACICLCCTVGLSIWSLSERHVEAYVFVCVEYHYVVKLVKCVNRTHKTTLVAAIRLPSGRCRIRVPVGGKY